MGRPSVREQIVEAAADRFHALGFNGCGVQEITDAANVPKGSFYNHFRSKESLAIEVLSRYTAERSCDRLTDAAHPPLARLRSHFDQLAARLAAREFRRGCLIGNLSTEMAGVNAAIGDAVEQALAAWSASVTTLIRAAQEQGALPATLDADALGRFIVNAWQGAVARSKVDRSARPIEDFFAVTFGTLLR